MSGLNVLLEVWMDKRKWGGLSSLLGFLWGYQHQASRDSVTTHPVSRLPGSRAQHEAEADGEPSSRLLEKV